MRILFLDEAGDHNLLIVDKDYPIFVLGGCIIDEKEHEQKAEPLISEFKKKLFGTDKLILHFRDYARSINGFEKMRLKNFRHQFYSELKEILHKIEFSLIACLIDKKSHLHRYDLRAVDPYLLSLEVLVEKFTIYLRENHDKGIIIAESRSPQLDNELNLSFLGLKINGTRFTKAKEITERISNFTIRKKEENIPGLQIIDSVVSPIGRKYLGYKDYLDYSLVESKLQKNKEGKHMGYGMVVLPKKLGGPRNGSDHPYESV